MLERLARAGMDCARLNFSHGTPGEHVRVIADIKRVSRRLGEHVAIMQDLPGPKIRVGTISGGSVTLKRGSRVLLTTKDMAGDEKTVPVKHETLPKYVSVGAKIFLSDGFIRLRVTDKTSDTISCRCEVGGVLTSGKGVNVPDLSEDFETFTEKDREYLEVGLENGVDFVAVSYVRSAKDVRLVRNFVELRKGNVSIIPKIEKKAAVENLEQIVRFADAVMVARGDLGVENPIEQIPELQKSIISLCNNRAIPVITATQMLESMVNNPSPTRAEVTDIANSIFDGTDAVMLSEETTVGKYPLQCVKVLDTVALNAEKELKNYSVRRNQENGSNELESAMCRAATSIAHSIGAKAIVALRGSVAAKLSSYRPSMPIFAVSEDEGALRKLKLTWGVTGVKEKQNDGSGAGNASGILLDRGLVGEEDEVVWLTDSGSAAHMLGMALVVARAGSSTKPNVHQPDPGQTSRAASRYASRYSALDPANRR